MRIYLCVLMLCAICFAGKAQGISFRHLTVDHGLSNNSVTSIYQDKEGIIWLGTNNGLNLYDGNRVRTYYQQIDNPNSLSGNVANQIVGDADSDTVYVRTQNGVSAVHIATETFTTLSTYRFSFLFFNKKLYAAWGNELLEYDGQRFHSLYRLIDKASIGCFYVDNDSILMGTDFGLYLLTGRKTLKKLIPDTSISDIFKDSRGDYWCCSSRGGKGLYRISKGEIVNYRNTPNNAVLTSNFTHHCVEDKQGDIWIGTFEGITQYRRSDNCFIQYKKKETANSLTHSSVWGLCCDRQGNIWAGTYYGGVNYFHPQKQIYREYLPSLIEKDGLSSGIISRMVKDVNGNLWIGTEGGGLNKYDPKRQNFKRYMADGTGKSISHNNVKAVYYDEKEEVLWIGTHMGGLNKLDLKTEKFTHYRHHQSDPNSLPSDIIQDILPYKDELVLATYNGIVLFNPADARCTRLLQDEKEHSFCQYAINLWIDRRGTLWIVNLNNGVCSYQSATGQFKQYKRNHVLPNSISSNNINAVYEDSEGKLWFCTSDNGIDSYHPETNSFENFNQKQNGLISNRVYNVCEIPQNRLLLTTDKGISVFDCRAHTCVNYDNLPQVSLKENALYQSADGEVFVGGLNGLFAFDVESIRHLARDYTLMPSSFMVNGEELPDSVFSCRLPMVDQLVLHPGQNMFSIGYALSDYLPFNSDRLFYYLEGFSTEWTEMNEQHLVSYTNLSPGKYVLKAKAVRRNGELVSESKIDIRVLPPFYRTTWAYLLYWLLGLTLLYSIVKSYKRRIKLQAALKYEEKYVEDLQEMNQAKLRFFTNISHEFRTPLTLIIGQVEMLLRLHSFATPIHSRLSGIYRNCIQMRELISELLDFRKQEQGYMTIKVGRYNMVDFLHEIYSSFQEYAEQQYIRLRFEKSDDDIQVWYDARQMRKVMNNLISNAFKYTPKAGNISISIRNRIEEVVIEVTDTGRGISAEDIRKIFERFYQTKQGLSTGTGIGLSFAKGIIELHHGSIEVLSKVDEGTTFSIHLKKGNSHFTEEELQAGEERVMEPAVGEKQCPILSDSAFTEEAKESVAQPEQKYKLLIVEDNEALRKMLTEIFKTFYQIETASDGKEGLDKVRTVQPDLILSDVLMPEMSGIELCQVVKKDMELCHIPIILLTARTAPEHTIEGLKTGADDYVTKPFNIDILLSRCNNLINNRLLLQEKFTHQPQASPQILATNDMDKIFVDSVMKVIEEHMDDVEFSVDVLACELGMARTKLFSKMKAITGQTPLEFILTIRLKRAAVMLLNNKEYSISEIADRLGFGSPRHFTRCFKEKYTITPQEYRRQKRGDK